MNDKITLKKEFTFNAPLEKVWDALTKPEQVKQYFFGTDLVTTWNVGDPIFWRGVWDGVAYEDKGHVLAFEPLKRLKYNYWSSFSGTEDIPENYADIEYTVAEKDGQTTLTITQTGIESEEKREHSEQNWSGVMGELEQFLGL